MIVHVQGQSNMGISSLINDENIQSMSWINDPTRWHSLLGAIQLDAMNESSCFTNIVTNDG